MGDEDQKLIAALAISELILKYGVTTALAIITAWDVKEPTAEDWESLKVKSASEYFNQS